MATQALAETHAGCAWVSAASSTACWAVAAASNPPPPHQMPIGIERINAPLPRLYLTPSAAARIAFAPPFANRSKRREQGGESERRIEFTKEGEQREADLHAW